MKNLNAEQVKKWLEICAEDTPYPDQSQALLKALALINSQEQRIKELAEDNEKLMSTSSLQGAIIGSLQVAANELTADKERLEKLLDDKCDRCLERERANTVRKMQERLKEHLEKPEFPWDSFTVAEEVIDQIAKEMLEGEK